MYGQELAAEVCLVNLVFAGDPTRFRGAEHSSFAVEGKKVVVGEVLEKVRVDHRALRVWRALVVVENTLQRA